MREARSAGVCIACACQKTPPPFEGEAFTLRSPALMKPLINLDEVTDFDDIEANGIYTSKRALFSARSAPGSSPSI